LRWRLRIDGDDEAGEIAPSGNLKSAIRNLKSSTHCGGACVGTGGRLLTAASQVRFLPPQLDRNGRASRLATAAASKAVER